MDTEELIPVISESAVPEVQGESIPIQTKEKMRSAYEMHELQGIPVPVVAVSLDVSISTVYRWLDVERKHFREDLESKPYADIICESIQFLQSFKHMILREASQGLNEEILDENNVVIPRKPLSPELKLRYWSLVKSIEGTKLDLMKDTGVLPKVPEHIYHSLDKEKNKIDSTSDREVRTPEQIKESILDLVKYGKTLN